MEMMRRGVPRYENENKKKEKVKRWYMHKKKIYIFSKALGSTTHQNIISKAGIISKLFL